MITLITMGQGNMETLRRTLESFKELFNEVIFGDLLIFDEDRDRLNQLKDQYNIHSVKLPFNYIYNHGFAATLNLLSAQASNDMVIYMNIGEIIDSGDPVTTLRNNPAFNCWYFNHATDPHQWIRCYNRNILRWSGPIHEEVIGTKNPGPTVLFTMADTEKDMDNLFKANVFNEIKDLVYMRQYMRIIEQPETQGACNSGWLAWAKDQTPPMRTRVENNKFYQAFENGSMDLLTEAMEMMSNDELMHESSKMVNFQGRRLDVL